MVDNAFAATAVVKVRGLVAFQPLVMPAVNAINQAATAVEQQQHRP
jgi:hypothetical protein